MVPDTAPEYQRMLERLRQARRDAGLTQAQVAERLGVRQTFVSKVELGERRIDPVELARFAAIYRQEIGHFLSPLGSDSPHHANE
jgi:transcriptional regulator with XRE-family HTH domain